MSYFNPANWFLPSNRLKPKEEVQAPTVQTMVEEEIEKTMSDKKVVRKKRESKSSARKVSKSD